MDGDGDDLLLEFACVNGGGGTLLGAEGILIHVLPGNPVGIGHVFGSDAHRGAHAQVGQGVPHGIPQLHVAVLLAVAGVKHHKGSGAHAVGTAGHNALGLPGHDLIEAQLNGGHGGGAVAVDGDSGHRVGEAGLDGGHAGQVVLQIGALVVAAPDHIVDEGGVHAGALDQSLHHRDGQVQGGQGLELTADGADGGAAGGYDCNMIHTE